MLTNCRISNAAVGFDVSQVKISSIRPKSRIHNSFLKKKRNTDVLSSFFFDKRKNDDIWSDIPRS